VARTSSIIAACRRDEALDTTFVGAVQDTLSGFCHGLTNAYWQSPGFSRDTLRRRLKLGNQQFNTIAYNLIVVAWDYSVTKRGEYPGYDAHKTCRCRKGAIVWWQRQC
jgi:hypothetical protein